MTDNCKNKLLSNEDIDAIYENKMKLNHNDYSHNEHQPLNATL